MNAPLSWKLAPKSRLPFLTRKEAAEFLGITVGALDKRAHRRQEPRYYRKGFSAQSRALYQIEDLEPLIGSHGAGE